MENHADNYPATSPDHVIIDIPGPDMQNPPSQPEEQTPELTEQAQDKPESEQSRDVQSTHAALSESEPDEPRRSTRDRHPPQKCTYEELGKPLILALSSLFEKLNFSQSLGTSIQFNSIQFNSIQFNSIQFYLYSP